MTKLPDLSQLTHEDKDALIRALWAQVQALTAQVQNLAARVAELEAKLAGSPKTPDNSSLPPSQGKKPNRAAKALRRGPCQWPFNLGRMWALKSPHFFRVSRVRNRRAVRFRRGR